MMALREPNIEERELARKPKPPQTLHPHVPLQLSSSSLAAELARLPARTSTPGTDEEWQKALNNARSQLEHQRIWHMNLALLQTYGPYTWRIHNYLLEATAKQAETTLEELKQRYTDVNRERKNSQWTELITSNLQIEMANVVLDAGVDRLNKKEAELASM
ncbi:breast carcinoma amplified sequence 2 [Suillus occidentalis]|nr:breast carcinoma amplified sequence 2 [Suillus occidentalis]